MLIRKLVGRPETTGYIVSQIYLIIQWKIYTLVFAGVCLSYQHIQRKSEVGESKMTHNVNTLAINVDELNYINRTRKVEGEILQVVLWPSHVSCICTYRYNKR